MPEYRSSSLLPIAQLVFYHTGDVEGDYTTLTGNYQSSTNLDELVASWTPDQMLPKSHRTEVKLPPRINGLKDGLQ
jgi:hypothetical protein